MSYGYKKATKKDEEELKTYTTAIAEEQPTAKTDTKGLEKALKDKESSLQQFATAEETKRKKICGDDYAAMKLKYGWKYDQPIE